MGGSCDARLTMHDSRRNLVTTLTVALRAGGYLNGLLFENRREMAYQGVLMTTSTRGVAGRAAEYAFDHEYEGNGDQYGAVEGFDRAWYRAGEDNSDRAARALGWFSVGLGLAQLTAPRSMANLIGVPNDEGTRKALLAVGIREVASGIGILASDRPARWVKGRVGGDVMDLALLGSAYKAPGANRNRVAMATAAVVGVTLLDWAVSRGRDGQAGSRAGGRTGGQADGRTGGVEVRRSITINRSASELYGFWRDLGRLPTIMLHLESVTELDDRRSRWKAKAPAGASVEWEAEIVEDRPDELLAWRSVEGSDIPNSGSVRFVPAPGGRGTEVHVELRYDPPGGKVGAAIAKLFGEEPGQQVDGDLRRFKQVIETGEVVLSDANVRKGANAAQPSDEPISAETLVKGAGR